MVFQYTVQCTSDLQLSCSFQFSNFSSLTGSYFAAVGLVSRALADVFSNFFYSVYTRCHRNNNNHYLRSKLLRNIRYHNNHRNNNLHRHNNKNHFLASFDALFFFFLSHNNSNILRKAISVISRSSKLLASSCASALAIT